MNCLSNLGEYVRAAWGLKILGTSLPPLDEIMAKANRSEPHTHKHGYLATHEYLVRKVGWAIESTNSYASGGLSLFSKIGFARWC